MCQLTKPIILSSTSATSCAIQSIQNARCVPSMEGPPSLSLASAEIRLELLQDSYGDLLIDAAILRITDISADIRIVRLVPNAPVPVLYLVSPPLLDAAPDNFATARDESPDVRRIVEGRMELGERHHGLRAHVEHGLQHGGEPMPLLERIRHRLVEDKDTDDLRAHEPQPPTDLRAMLAH